MRPLTEANLQSACKNYLPTIHSEISLTSYHKFFSIFWFRTNPIGCFKTLECNYNLDSFLPPNVKLCKWSLCFRFDVRHYSSLVVWPSNWKNRLFQKFVYNLCKLSRNIRRKLMMRIRDFEHVSVISNVGGFVKLWCILKEFFYFHMLTPWNFQGSCTYFIFTPIIFKNCIIHIFLLIRKRFLKHCVPLQLSGYIY